LLVVAVRDKHNGARMAFSPCNLSILAYANVFTLWHYDADAENWTFVSDDEFFDHHLYKHPEQNALINVVVCNIFYNIG